MAIVQGLDFKIYSWKRKEGEQELTTKIKFGSAFLITALRYHHRLMVKPSIFVHGKCSPSLPGPGRISMPKASLSQELQCK